MMSKDNKEIETIIDELKSADWQIRDKALKKFLSLQDFSLIAPIFQQIKNESTIIQLYFLHLLKNFLVLESVQYLIFFLNSNSKQLVKEAGRLLNAIKDERKYDYIINLLDSDNISVCMYAIESLGRGRQVNAIIPLIKKLYHTDKNIRLKTIGALGLIGNKRAVTSIVDLLDREHSDIEIICDCIFALVLLKYKKFGNTLKKFLKYENAEVRKYAIWAIGELGLNKLTVFLENMLISEKDPDVVVEIIRCMSKFGNEFMKKSILVKKISNDSGNSNIRKFAVSAIGEEDAADVCLIVEGTYPYIAGGVGSWIQSLIKELPKLKFFILHIGSTSEEMKVFKYNLPENVVGIREVYLHDISSFFKKQKTMNKNDWQVLIKFLYDVNNKNNFNELIEAFDRFSVYELVFSREIWDVLQKLYKDKIFHGISFLDFFWTYRSLLIPLLKIKDINLPKAELYHSTSTGYAGLIGTICKKRFNKPFMLTEHGLYHRERRIEIEDSSWMPLEYDEIRVNVGSTGVRDIWMDMFNFLSKAAYDYADKIITLYEDNRRCQIEMGADPVKTIVIPNGVDADCFSSLERKKNADNDVFIVALVGRVVPIKDIETFIRAAKIVSGMIPKSEFLVIGPLDEDTEYAETCKLLVELLDIKDKLKFTGKVDLSKYYPIIDVVVFTSISEAQPISLLEAMSCGIPSVVTNVGSCPELVLGGNEDDKKIGAAGIITFPGQPEETARSIINIFHNDSLRENMQKAGIERVRRFYQHKDTIENYRKLYKEFLGK